MTPLAPWLQLAGLVFGSVGAFCLAFAQGREPGDDTVMERDAEQPGRPSRRVAFVFLRYPRLWCVGFVLLGLGFLLQLVGYILVLTSSM